VEGWNGILHAVPEYIRNIAYRDLLINIEGVMRAIKPPPAPPPEGDSL
jgi:hypothetical protein